MYEAGMWLFLSVIHSLLRSGAVILGVSKDSVAFTRDLKKKYGLAFTLLADPERKGLLEAL